jgi:hypothetical protein
MCWPRAAGQQLLECRLSIEEPCASDNQMAHRILNL